MGEVRLQRKHASAEVLMTFKWKLITTRRYSVGNIISGIQYRTHTHIQYGYTILNITHKY